MWRTWKTTILHTYITLHTIHFSATCTLLFTLNYVPRVLRLSSGYLLPRKLLHQGRKTSVWLTATHRHGRGFNPARLSLRQNSDELKNNMLVSLDVHIFLLATALPVFKAPQTLFNLFEMSMSTRERNTCICCIISTRWVTDLEQLQYDLCECFTKSQAPAFSARSSSQVPLVAAENFRLRKKNNFETHFYKWIISSASRAAL